MVNWNCTDCYYGQRNGHKACPRTNCTIPNLQLGHRYSFSVQAVTDFGPGESSMISVMISRYFGKVRNLQASFDDDYIMAITWDPPLNMDTKDIKVTCQSLKTRNYFLNSPVQYFEIYCYSFVARRFIVIDVFAGSSPVPNVTVLQMNDRINLERPWPVTLYNKLEIADTTAAPALYIVGQLYSCSLCSSLKYTDS